jgi:hypothetical protein
VSLSFISFFIDYKSAGARAPLGVTSVLTITTMTGGAFEFRPTLEQTQTTRGKSQVERLPFYLELLI